MNANVVGMECSIYVQRSVITLLYVSEKTIENYKFLLTFKYIITIFEIFIYRVIRGNRTKPTKVVKSQRGVLKWDPMADTNYVSPRPRSSFCTNLQTSAFDQLPGGDLALCVTNNSDNDYIRIVDLVGVKFHDGTMGRRGGINEITSRPMARSGHGSF